jgi:hypothetical protein
MGSYYFAAILLVPAPEMDRNSLDGSANVVLSLSCKKALNYGSMCLKSYSLPRFYWALKNTMGSIFY